MIRICFCDCLFQLTKGYQFKQTLPFGKLNLIVFLVYNEKKQTKKFEKILT